MSLCDVGPCSWKPYLFMYFVWKVTCWILEITLTKEIDVNKQEEEDDGDGEEENELGEEENNFVTIPSKFLNRKIYFQLCSEPHESSHYFDWCQTEWNEMKALE